MNVYHAPTINAAALPAFRPVADTPQGKPGWNDHLYHFFATRCPVLNETVAFRVERLPGGLAQLAFKRDGETEYRVPTFFDRVGKPIIYDTAVTDHLALVAAGYAAPCFRYRLRKNPGLVPVQWPVWLQLDNGVTVKVTAPNENSLGHGQWAQAELVRGFAPGRSDNPALFGFAGVAALGPQPDLLRRVVENWLRPAPAVA